MIGRLAYRVRWFSAPVQRGAWLILLPYLLDGPSAADMSAEEYMRRKAADPNFTIQSTLTDVPAVDRM